MKCFRFDNDAAYEQLRRSLDAANGYPDGVTETTIQPATLAPRDSQGRVVLAIKDTIYDAAVIAGVIPSALGNAAEISAAAYLECVTGKYT